MIKPSAVIKNMPTNGAVMLAPQLDATLLADGLIIVSLGTLSGFPVPVAGIGLISID